MRRDAADRTDRRVGTLPGGHPRPHSLGRVLIRRDGETVAFIAFIDMETHGYHYLRSMHGPAWIVKPDEALEREAIDAIAEKLNAVLAKDPQAASFYSFTGDLGKLSWEAPTRYAATVGATTWDIEGIMGDHGASMGMTMVFGTHRGAHDSRDYLNSKLLIVWGRNVLIRTRPSCAITWPRARTARRSSCWKRAATSPPHARLSARSTPRWSPTMSKTSPHC